jgi:hypothetical protein
VSGLRERIANICENYFRALEADGYRPEGCTADHLADMLIDQLGLRQEWTWAWPRTNQPDSEIGYGFIVDSREEAAAEMDGRCHIVTRYATEWQDEQ